MKKSVYSLVLSDAVVDAVDRRAALMNTSRSNLINQILAEYASLTTPEKRMSEIFEKVKSAVLNYGTMQVQDTLSDSMMSLKSTVKYKYNPTVRYIVELYRNYEEAIGRLKVYIRTQSPSLIHEVNNFFQLWAAIEGVNCKQYSIEDGKFERIFIAKPDIGDEQIAGYISDYIKRLDRCMKEYFAHLDDPSYAKSRVIQQYEKGESL